MNGLMKVQYRNIDYEVANDPSREAFFVFGVRKSGSSILNSMLGAVARINGIQYVDVAGKLFERGLTVAEWQNDAAMARILYPGNLYGGYRNFPAGLRGADIFVRSRKVLLVRDPRDALVSEYFSNAYSHSIPAEGEARQDMLSRRAVALGSAIEDYVLRMAPALKRTLAEYTCLGRDDRLLTFRYEDVITRKDKLLTDICAFFGWTLSDQQLRQILGWADVIPTEERPTEFVRKVTPGDHIEKLSAETIDRLDRLLSEEMTYYGYR